MNHIIDNIILPYLYRYCRNEWDTTLLLSLKLTCKHWKKLINESIYQPDIILSSFIKWTEGELNIFKVIQSHWGNLPSVTIFIKTRLPFGNFLCLHLFELIGPENGCIEDAQTCQFHGNYKNPRLCIFRDMTSMEAVPWSIKKSTNIVIATRQYMKPLKGWIVLELKI